MGSVCGGVGPARTDWVRHTKEVRFEYVFITDYRVRDTPKHKTVSTRHALFTYRAQVRPREAPSNASQTFVAWRPAVHRCSIVAHARFTPHRSRHRIGRANQPSERDRVPAPPQPRPLSSLLTHSIACRTAEGPGTHRTPHTLSGRGSVVHTMSISGLTAFASYTACP